MSGSDSLFPSCPLHCSVYPRSPCLAAALIAPRVRLHGAEGGMAARAAAMKERRPPVAEPCSARRHSRGSRLTAQCPCQRGDRDLSRLWHQKGPMAKGAAQTRGERQAWLWRASDVVIAEKARGRKGRVGAARCRWSRAAGAWSQRDSTVWHMTKFMNASRNAVFQPSVQRRANGADPLLTDPGPEKVSALCSVLHGGGLLRQAARR